MTDRTSKHISRRKMLKAVGVGAAAGLAGCTSRIPGLGQSEFEQQLETVREDAAKYDGNPGQAVQDGFLPFGPYVPGMGLHFQSQERTQTIVQDGFSIENYNILVFNDEGELGGVEYGAPASQVQSTPDLFASDDEEWEIHQSATHVFATGNGSVTPREEITVDQWINNANWAEFRPVDSSVEIGDEYRAAWGRTAAQSKSEEQMESRIVDFVTTHPDLVSTHVWTHAENPDGVFATTNPSFYTPSE